MKKGIVFVALLAATSALAQTLPPPAIVSFPLQYAAKFVCGKPGPTDGYPFQVGAHGNYFTQINVHNPARRATVTIRKKFINAQPNERPTRPTQFFPLALEADWATQIDCHNILDHLGLPPATPYVEGFVIIESTLELDVVGLYTAEGPSSLISTMEIERVPPRHVQ